MGRRREELLVIHKQDPAFATIASIMLTQIIGKHPHSEMKAFIRQARSVFVYHVGKIQRHQRTACQRLMHLPVLYLRCADGPHFTPLMNWEVDVLSGHPLMCEQLTSPFSRFGKKVQLETLNAILPAYSVTASFAVFEHRIERKNAA